MGEYADTIDNVIGYLETERDRRVNALNSGDFCDTYTLKKNIDIITEGVVSMKMKKMLTPTMDIA